MGCEREGARRAQMRTAEETPARFGNMIPAAALPILLSAATRCRRAKPREEKPLPRNPILLLSVAVLLTGGGAATAQLPPFGDVYAVIGARIEIGDGRVIEKGTVLLRDGLIEAAGVDV